MWLVFLVVVCVFVCVCVCNGVCVCVDRNLSEKRGEFESIRSDCMTRQ